MIITRILLPLSAVNTVALLVGIMLPSLLLAQSAPTSGLAEPGHPSEKKPDIVRFHVENEGKGALHIIYGDGTEVEISKERGRFDDSNGPLTQEAFSDIQLADDCQHVGWLADYMICVQSYPCSPELVIYRPGHKFTHVPPPYGVFWRWRFVVAGKC